MRAGLDDDGALLAKIRELEAARAAEAEARSQLEAVLEATAEGIIVCAVDARIQRANREAARVFGVAPRELDGRLLTEFIPDSFHAGDGAGFLRTMADCQASSAHRCAGLRVDGREFPLELVVHSTRTGDGEPRFTVALRDIGDALALQAQLALADRMVSAGSLAAGVAHEINNPLAYLSMNVEYVLDAARQAQAGVPLPPLEEIIDAMEQAQDGARRVELIVRDLRTIARADPGHAAGVDLASVLDTALRMAQGEIRPRAQVLRFGRARFLVQADEARLSQAFLNLLLNAAQSISPGNPGRNFIEVRTALLLNGSVEVRIRDTGAGIPPEHRQRIFDPFFTTRPPGQGLGLGLAVCHAVVTGLGGRIYMEPAPERGSVFVVELPGAELATPAPELVDPEGPRRFSLLVIDDEPLVCRALERALPELDLVTEVRARHALGRMAAGEKFDAILCDVLMPEMGAMQLWHELGDVRPEMRPRIIFMTGGVAAPEQLAFLGKLPNHCLEKPLDLTRLREAVEQIGQATPRRRTTTPLGAIRT